MSTLTRAIFACLLLGLVACSNAGLQPIDEQVTEIVDDRLDLDGRVCTSVPTEQLFPVKIMFIVDSSGSMQFTDPSDATASGCDTLCTTPTPNGWGLSAGQCGTLCQGAENPGRQAAVQRVIDRFQNNPAVSFSVIRFNGRITVNGGVDDQGFTNDPGTLNQAAASLAQADITTDYQGALSSAFQVLQKDMIQSSPVDRARTKYVVIFLSDGSPDPVCEPGCGNDAVDIAGVTIDFWCDLPRDQWCDPDPRIFIGGELCDSMQQWYPAMNEPCRAYNTDDDIVRKVNEIMDLGEQYGVGEIRINTAFLWVDGLPAAVMDIFDLDKDRSEALLRQMALAGDGVYRSFNAGQAIDFLDINYSSVTRPFGMVSLIATNPHARPGINKLLVDSDGDGVDDEREFEAGSRDNSPDTDGDGYSDKFEIDRSEAGFDPTDAALPVRICPSTERADRDGDGLRDCEEAILGTESKLADTDRDRIPDGLEVWFDADPLNEDTGVIDPDLDQKASLLEIRHHSNPAIADPEMHASFRYLYDTEEQPEEPDRRRCWDFSVRRIRLVTTTQSGGVGTQGFNELMVYFGEGLEGDKRDFGNFKAACVRAQYVGQTCEANGIEVSCGFKDPASGQITLAADDFYDLPELANRRQAARNDPSVDPCVGVEMP